MSSQFCLTGWWVLPACFLHASCVLPACFRLYCCYMLQYTKITTSKLNWTETHTILPIFLGSTQEAPKGASCMLPSVASLMGRSVYTYILWMKSSSLELDGKTTSGRYLTNKRWPWLQTKVETNNWQGRWKLSEHPREYPLETSLWAWLNLPPTMR